MRKLNLLVEILLLALIAPAVAEMPSDAVSKNREAAEQLSNRSIINPMDPAYVWGNPFAIVLSGINPAIFQSASFGKDPDGMASGNLWTSSISHFRKSDPNSGFSHVARKSAKIGLVYWP